MYKRQVIILDALIQNGHFDPPDTEFVVRLRRFVTAPVSVIWGIICHWGIVIGNLRVIATIINNNNRVTIEFRVGKQAAGISEIHDGKILFAVVRFQTSASTDDLLKLGHGIDVVVQHNQLARFAVNAGCHQFGGGNNYGVGAILGNKIIQLRLALCVIACYTHNILGVFSNQVCVFIYQRLPHTLCMVNIHAEYDGFGKPVGVLQKLGDTLCYSDGTLINNCLLYTSDAADE